MSDLHASVAQARANAIIQGTQNTLEIVGPICPDSPETLVFFPNGTASAAEICLLGNDKRRIVELDPLTGQLTQVNAP